MNTEKLTNPKWWNDKHEGAWDRVKVALARDWAQLKSAIKRGWESARKTPVGEGSYEGTRRYNEHARDFAKSGKVEPAAEEARDAVDGKDKDRLEEAEAAGKRGPKH